MKMRMEKKQEIKTIEDLEDYIYHGVGILCMEDVRLMLDVIKQHQRLLKEHKR